MGLTNSSVGANASREMINITRRDPSDRVIALAGNPNVGKSTLFNSLTGMNQHTGNWPGKTVGVAQSYCRRGGQGYVFIDLPGTYSLMAHSAEEEVAGGFISFGNPDAVVVVCDATCLERNLNLALQIIEMTPNVVLCVNLIDEAERKGVEIDCRALSRSLGVPAVPMSARKKRGFEGLFKALDSLPSSAPPPVRYPSEIERAISVLEPDLKRLLPSDISARRVALKLISGDEKAVRDIEEHRGIELIDNRELAPILRRAQEYIASCGLTGEMIDDEVVSAIMKRAEEVSAKAVSYKNKQYDSLDRKIDRVVTSRRLGYPLMLALLAFILWLTITGANYPSQLLSDLLFGFQRVLDRIFISLNSPEWLRGLLVDGLYKVLAWVTSVMLPPMAIFFPLFTLIEDAGYLPRVAYNLDGIFKKCSACGKQALTACMGLGCNAAGVVGCRIIDSPRERMLAILTNSFMPCNGRFPTLIAIITMFFVPASGLFASILPALMLTALILLGVALTFGVTNLLSKTLLKGMPSSFTLELPPYRPPEVGKVIVRSIFDRTLFVLGRAAAVAAPAGMVIWLMANIEIGGASLLNICAGFLDPFAGLLGLDGVILMAFILGFPANEIVVPIIIMAYMAQGSLTELNDLSLMKQLFISNGWTPVTAMCTMLFSLIHWPCSTTLLTIKKETGSLKWTAVALLLPTVSGMLICMAVNFIGNLII